VRRVCMDYGAAMPVDPSVLEAMEPYYIEAFGNPSSLHFLGAKAREALEEARGKVATLVGAERKDEIIFTSGGTESNNLAVKGTAFRNKAKGSHIITSAIEHISILNSCKFLAKNGFKVTYIPVDRDGVVDLEQLKAEINRETILISIMYANGEIGTIQPIKEIGEIAREKGVCFHVDGVATVGQLPINLAESPIDLLSLSSNDIYGPKGVGALYIRRETKIESILQGGGQERGLRSGSENIPGIVGMGKAAELTKERMDGDIEHITRLRDKLIEGVLGGIEETYLNGHPTRRLPNNASFRFSGVEGEAMLLNLEEKGVTASTGSACSSKTLEPSHVLRAIGLQEIEAHGSLLFTLSRLNTEEDVNYVLEILPSVVGRLREISPIWKKDWRSLGLSEETC